MMTLIAANLAPPAGGKAVAVSRFTRHHLALAEIAMISSLCWRASSAPMRCPTTRSI